MSSYSSRPGCIYKLREKPLSCSGSDRWIYEGYTLEPMTENICCVFRKHHQQGRGNQLPGFLGTCSLPLPQRYLQIVAHLSIIYGCQAARLGLPLLPGEQMSRNPDISTVRGNICVVASEQSDRGCRKPQGILSCGSSISRCLTPAQRVWRANPCAPAGFCYCNEQTVSGQHQGLRKFWSCCITVDVSAFLELGFTSFRVQTVFLFCLPAWIISWGSLGVP